MALGVPLGSQDRACLPERKHHSSVLRYSGACGGCFTGLHRSRNSQNTFPLLCVTPAVRGCFAQGTLLAAITDQPGLTAELCAMLVRDPHVRSDLA